jgi:hypothetical protein
MPAASCSIGSPNYFPIPSPVRVVKAKAIGKILETGNAANGAKALVAYQKTWKSKEMLRQKRRDRKLRSLLFCLISSMVNRPKQDIGAHLQRL